MDYNLDSLEVLKNLDKSGIASSIASLDDQILESWNGTKALPYSPDLGNKKNIMLSGMGGSALGGRIVQSAFNKSLRSPFFISTENTLPHWVNHETLVIISSYSGNTAETIASLRDAQKKQASILIVSTGGKLAQIANDESITSYIFSPVANPSGQPRMALGYSIGSLLGILSTLQYISLDNDDILFIRTSIQRFVEEYSYSIPATKNVAKLHAQKLFDKIFIGVGSEHLVGVLHAFKNQLNENAKTFATYVDLPEMNHHFIEGLRFPTSLKTSAHLMFFESDLYNEEYKKRYKATKEIIEKNGIPYSVYKLQSESILEQVFEVLVFGSYVSLYCALLHGINPAPIPMVDYLKKYLIE